jgi:hypothetical protein
VEWISIKKLAMKLGDWAAGSHACVERILTETRSEFLLNRHNSLTAVDTEKGISQRHGGHFAIEHDSREATIAVDCLEDDFLYATLQVGSTDGMRSSHFKYRERRRNLILCLSPPCATLWRPAKIMPGRAEITGIVKSCRTAPGQKRKRKRRSEKVTLRIQCPCGKWLVQNKNGNIRRHKCTPNDSKKTTTMRLKFFEEQVSEPIRRHFRLHVQKN